LERKSIIIQRFSSDPGNGIQATSSTWAKKHIFGWSDEEVRLTYNNKELKELLVKNLKQLQLLLLKQVLFDNIDKLVWKCLQEATPTAGAATTPGGTEELGDHHHLEVVLKPAPPQEEVPAGEKLHHHQEVNQN
jgi:hypothetical protein